MSYTDTVCELAWNNTPEWDANASLIALAPTLARQVIDQQAEIDRLREEYAKLEAIYSTACQIAAAELKEAK